MKFRRPEKFEPWSKEKTEQQIENIQLEIKELNREENDINSTIAYWRNEKNIIQAKISNKCKYINQLNEQLNSEQNPERSVATEAK
jgi:predicted  nucleic acid-binding Zn-ribbon protein